jgi:hypothetical protein
MSSERLTQLYEKMAGLVARNVADEQVAAAFSLEMADFIAIKNSDAFRQILQLRTAQLVEQTTDIDDGWDSVEAQAIRGINDYLKTSVDPQFALKAAAIANKAERRFTNKAAQRPVQVATENRVTLVLSDRITNRIQLEGVRQTSDVVSITSNKEVDMATPKFLESQFAPVVDVANEDKVSIENMNLEQFLAG